MKKRAALRHDLYLPRRQIPARAAAVFGAAALILVIFSFAAPLPTAFSPLFTGGGGWLEEFIRMISGGRFRAIVGFTLAQAAGSAGIALLLGIPGAFLTARRNFPGKRFFSALSAVPLCVPPLLIALGFIGFYGMQGIFNRLLMALFSLEKPPITVLYSFWGIIIAQGFYNFPVIMRMAGDLWMRQPQDEIDAARLLGAGRFRIFRTITLFHLAPAIGAGTALVFLYCFFSFVIVLMFGAVGVSTIEVEIYQAARTDMNYPLAAALGVTETVIALLAVGFYGRIERAASEGGASLGGASGSGFREFHAGRLAKKELLPAGCYFALVLLLLIAPLFSIIWNSFTASGTGYLAERYLSVRNYAVLFGRSSFRLALKNTLIIGAGTALVSTAAGAAFAIYERYISGGRGRSPGFQVLPLMPLAVSSIVLGFGWSRLVPDGSPLILIAAQSSLAWPFAMKQISAALDRVPRNIFDAAKLLSPSPLQAVFRVYLPLCFRGCLTGGAFAFAISAGDASLPLMLSVRNFETLPLFLFRLAGSYRFSEAAACGVILAVITGGIFFLRDGRKKTRSGSGFTE